MGLSYFIIRTDHEELRWLLTSDDASRRLARCLIRLLEFDFKVIHRSGTKQLALDALSLLKTERGRKTNLDEEQPVLMLDETERPQDAETEFFDQTHPDIEQADNQMDGHGEEKNPETLREQSDAHANDRA